MDRPRSSMSMREFAREAGTSASTVSRAFSHPDLLAPRTRDRILKHAARTGWRPSPVTRAAIGKSTCSVGILLPDLAVSFFADIAHGIQQTLLAADYLPVLLSHSEAGGLRGVQRLVDHRVDALILGLSDEAIRQDQLRAITGPGLPLVLVDQPHPGLAYDSVLNDDDDGGYQAGRHLAELGHRRVGTVHYGEGSGNCELRIAGCQRALTAAGARIRKRDIVHVPPFGPPEEEHRAVQAGLERVLRAADRPTAIFATTDLFARDVLVAARRLGLRVPADLSVVGFADLGFAALVDPPLTTLRQNGEELGRQAAELVLTRLAEPDRERRRVLVPTRLVIRESTGPAAAA